MQNVSADELIDQYRELHSHSHRFGGSSGYVEVLGLFISYLKPETILDYGCGKGYLLEVLAERFPEIKFYGYDPAIPGKDVLPIQKADLVINTDVLEHIPEDALPEVIKGISSISENVFFGLHHALAAQILPNGQNAHCTVKQPIWYYRLFSEFFSAVFLLDAEKNDQSVAITFPVTPKLVAKYYDLIRKPLCDTLYMRFVCWWHWRLNRTSRKMNRALKKLKGHDVSSSY